MKNKKLWLICLKWGLVLAAGLAALELVKMFARRVEYGSTQMFDIAMIIGYIFILYVGVKEFKANYPDRLSFSKAFLAGFVISFVGSILFLGYDLLHYQIVEKDGMAKKYETALANYRNVIEKDTVHSDELAWYADTVRDILARQEECGFSKDSLADSLRSDVRKGVDMIGTFFAEKLVAQRSLDTAENYKMSNISAFGRKVLVETMVLYVEQNEARLSTQYIKEIVQQANFKLENVNLVEHRFELTKSRVPHYDKPGRYAIFSAMMDLLYGMFFSIFVAMYHYSSKNPIEDAPENVEVVEETETKEETEN